jgi:glycerophosphoryl diester phosphodiesterase
VARRPLRLAHRGDWRVAPENTLAAFSAALAIPACDGLELDVRRSADGVLVVCHDATLARVHGRPDPVASVGVAVLQALGLPTLAETLLAVGRHAFLDIELKGDPGPDVVTVLAAGRGPGLSNAVVSSFDPVALERVAHLAPAWPRWLNSERLDPVTVARAVELGCRAVAVEWRAIDRRTIGLARAAGLEVAAWTVRRRPTFDRLASLGVIAVCVEAAALDG